MRVRIVLRTSWQSKFEDRSMLSIQVRALPLLTDAPLDSILQREWHQCGEGGNGISKPWTTVHAVNSQQGIKASGSLQCTHSQGRRPRGHHDQVRAAMTSAGATSAPLDQLYRVPYGADTAEKDVREVFVCCLHGSNTLLGKKRRDARNVAVWRQ